MDDHFDHERWPLVTHDVVISGPLINDRQEFSCPLRPQHAAARAAIRDTILGQTMPVELLIDALMLPIQPYLRQEAIWAFEQSGRGVIFIDELPLVQDQDKVTGFVAAP
jgi:hypothetical protein